MSGGKMKKKIVIGSPLAVFILVMLPSISAVEFNAVIEANRSQLLEQMQSVDLDELMEKVKGYSDWIGRISFFLQWLITMLIMVPVILLLSPTIIYVLFINILAELDIIELYP